jgi:hypothetical protein
VTTLRRISDQPAEPPKAGLSTQVVLTYTLIVLFAVTVLTILGLEVAGKSASERVEVLMYSLVSALGVEGFRLYGKRKTEWSPEELASAAQMARGAPTTEFRSGPPTAVITSASNGAAPAPAEVPDPLPRVQPIERTPVEEIGKRYEHVPSKNIATDPPVYEGGV